MAFRKFVSLYSTSVSKPSSSISPSTAWCREFIVVDKLAMVRKLKEQGLPSDLAETIVNSSEATLYSTSSKGHGVEEVPSDVNARMKSWDAQEMTMSMVTPTIGFVAAVCVGAGCYKCLNYIWDEERWFGHKKG